MAQPWERDWTGTQQGGGGDGKPWERSWGGDAAETPADASPDRSAADWLKDTGVAALKGAVGLPEAAFGLADLARGVRIQGLDAPESIGKQLQDAGIDFGGAKRIIDQWFSPQQQAANKAVSGAEGFIPTLEAAAQNPSAVGATVVESLPQMLGGAGAARGLLTAAPKMAPWAAGAVGEGLLGAGSAAESIREHSADGNLTDKQRLAAAASGLGTAAFGAAGGKIAQRLGLADVDTMLAAGTTKLAKSPPGFVRQVLGAGISEGVFEELPQSIQEQMWQNWALGKDITEGVGNAAAMGLLAGAGMGMAGGGFSAVRSGGAKGAPEATVAPLAPTSESGATGATGEPAQADEVLGADPGVSSVSSVPPPGDSQNATAEPDPLTAVPSAPSALPKIAATTGAPTEFSTESGSRLQAAYSLVEADDLQTSHDTGLRANPNYPPELQPRKRERAASAQQIQSIVGRLDPARLGLSADAATGAPIIGDDGLVESGNARTIALKRVYQANGQKAEDYRAWLRDNAAQFGLTPEQIDGMQRPVLVRVRTTPVDRSEFARQANAPTVAQMSPSEQARADAARIDAMDDLNPTDDGDFATSRDFIRRFMARLPQTEQGGMIDAGGQLSSAGYARVRNAVLAKAYGDSPVLTRMVESMDDNQRNISKALMIAAPRVARARAAIGEGRLHDADLTPHLVGAAETLGRLKDRGTSVDDALAQAGLLGDEFTDETRELIRYLADNVRRPRRMADFIGAYFDALEAAGDPGQASLLDDAAPPTTRDLIGAARRETEDPRGTAQDPQRGDAGATASAGDAAAGQPADAQGAGRGGQGDAAQDGVAPKTIAIDGKDYDLDAPSFGLQVPPRTLDDAHPLLTETARKPTAVYKGEEMPREEMARRIIDGHFEGAKPAPAGRRPVAYLMGGGGASGKGTLLKQLIEQGAITDEGAVHIDPDEVKKAIPEYDQIVQAGDGRAAAVVHEESSDIAKAVQARALEGRFDLVLDTTLSDPKKGARTIEELKAAGYEVRLFGITIDPRVAVVRAMKRAKRSFRYVPIHFLLAAHKGFTPAFARYAQMADVAELYDNTEGFVRLAKKGDGGLTFDDQARYNEAVQRSADVDENAGTLRGIWNSDAAEAGSRAQPPQPGVDERALGRDRGDSDRAAPGDARAQGGLGRVAAGEAEAAGLTAEDLRAARAQAVNELKDGLGDLAALMSRHTRAALLPEDTPGLMPALVKIASAGIKIVGTDFKRLLAFMKKQVRTVPEVGSKWNLIADDTYRNAALQALQGGQDQQQAGLFDEAEAGQMDLFSAPAESGAQGEQDGPRADDRNSDAGAGPGAAPEPEGIRPAGRARAGSGGSGARGDGAGSAAAAGGREVGQPGAGGVRGQDADGRRDGARGKPRRGAAVPAGRDIQPKSGRNYRLTDDDLNYQGSWQKKAARNVDAVELLKKLQADGRQASPDEQRTLAQFIGWGSSEIANNIFGKKLDQARDALAAYERAVAQMDARKRDDLSKGGLYRGHYADSGYYDAQQVLRAAGKLGPHDFPQKITRAELDAARPDPATRRWVELRDRLKAALTSDEWAEASRSTQYAHYTSGGVVRAMWAAAERFGFKGGAVLEPGAGSGVFPGLMPDALAANTAYTGIEFDSITGGILQQLQPDERILIDGYQNVKLPKDFYDLAIGNPPFSGTKILSDPEYAQRAFSLHDYFFAKTIDRVRPGGLVMFVTSRYTMDKLTDKARQYLADRADLVGAIRLPQTAFKANAGTDVVTDVLFLRKKVPGETFEAAQPWTRSLPMKVGGSTFPVNEYFHAHPEMVLGQPSDTGEMQNSPEPQYTVLAPDGDIESLFTAATGRLPADVYRPKRGSAGEAAAVRELDFNPKAQKEGNYYLTDAGVLMQREEGVGKPVDARSPKDMEILKAFVPLRDALKQAHYDQLNGGDWESSLKALQAAYKKFTAAHGAVNQSVARNVRVKVDELDEAGEPTGRKVDDVEERRVFPLLNVINDDPDYTLVMALEKVNEETGAVSPGAFLSDRVLGAPKLAQITSPHDALLAVLNDTGQVDIGAIAERMDMEEGEVLEALGSAVYLNPEGEAWETADQYLSGNVKAKLATAEAAAKTDRRFERNVEALRAAQPAPKNPADINIGIGMNWIPGSDYAAFLRQLSGIRAEVIFNEATRQWSVKPEKSVSRDDMRARADWGTLQRSAADLLEHALTGRPIKITKQVGSGKDAKTVTDAEATEAANAKLEALKEEFTRWVWTDAERSNRLVQTYNDKFNTTVPRAFDGRHLTLPGSSQQFKIFDHVKRGAWRIIQSGNTYLAHAVGSGKTFQMVISAMEQKRLGLIKKPMVIVPNHMLQQFAREWQELYPAAKLMVADEVGFHTDNRRRWAARVALSDLDGVIMTHSAFKLLDLDPEYKKQIIEEQLEYLRASYEEAGGDVADLQFDENGKLLKASGSRDPTVKQIEKRIENLEEKLKKAFSGANKDRNVSFDQLGVDMLYVDEAHLFRKLDYATSRQVKGISPEGSDQALDLYIKTRWLDDKNPGRSLVMASGTVITNTMAEMYSTMRFMARRQLQERGIEDFDSWAAMFGRERTTLEANAAGKYEPVTRFNKFVNVGELVQSFREFADVVTADQLAALLGDKRPKVEGGSRKIIVTPKTKAYADYQKVLAQRYETSRKWKPSRDEPNNPDPVIAIIGDGRLAAIDMRFVSPGAPNDPDSKLNRMIDDVIREFKATAGMEFHDAKTGKLESTKGASMMVFSDLGFGAGVAANRGFSARAWMEKRLRDAKIPPSQVAFMSDYKKSADKLKLFRDVNAGRVRLLIGSSKNMGTGVNAQQRLLHLFHLDSPWFPADLEQREGRIVRQGNKNKVVNLHAYAAKGSYDETMWGMLARKQFFIDQAMSGDQNLREIEDLDSVSQFDMAAALVAEDPRVLQLAGLKAEAEKLQRLYRAHEDQRFRFRGEFDAASKYVDVLRAKLPEAEKMAAKAVDLSGDRFRGKVGDTVHTERTKWGEAIKARAKELGDAQQPSQTIGDFGGFPLRFVSAKQGEDGPVIWHVQLDTPEPTLLVSYGTEAPAGMAMRAVNALADLGRGPARIREKIQQNEATMDALRPRLETPFPMAEMLAGKLREAAELEAQIAADSKDRAWRVESVHTGKGFDVQANSEAVAIEKAMATNGGQPEDWRAYEAKAADPAPADEAVRLSRGTAAGGMPLSDLRDVRNRVVAALPGLPPVVVMPSPEHAPPALQAAILRRGAWGDVEGALHGGKIYLFASGLADAARAEFVLAEHEAAHAGLRGLLGDKVKQAMQILHNESTDVRRAAAPLIKGGMPLAEAVEEVIVDIPTARLARLKGWRALVGKVRDALRARGFERTAATIERWLAGHLSQQQRADLLVADLVRAARGFVERKPGRQPAMAGTALSTGRLSDDLAAQEKWLTDQAKAAGHASIDEMLERDYPAFERLAAQWRAEHPADALLSRATPADAAVTPQSAAERAESIIQTKAGTPKPLDWLARGATKAIFLDRLAAMVYGKGSALIDRLTPEAVKAGVVSDYGVPEAVIDQRARMQGSQRQQLREAGKLLEKLATLTRAESRVAYEWMSGDDTRTADELMKDLPEESVAVLRQVRELVDQMSREAVRLGQLEPDAFERHRFAYLRRSYFKHESLDSVDLKGSDRTRRERALTILGDQYKGRGMVAKAPMRQVQNLAPEWWKRKLVDGKADTSLKGEKFERLERRAPVGAGTAGLEGMGENTRPGRLLEVHYWPAGEPKPAKYSDWESAGTWEVRDTKAGDLVLWRDFTKAERVKMGEIDEARFAIARTLQRMIHDVEVGRYLEWLAQHHAKKDGEEIPGTVVEASERALSVFKPGEWVQVPETKIPGTSVQKYGMLAGRYLPGPIWNDLRQVVNGRFKPLGENYAAVVNAWKVSKTALSPGVHTNNVMSNIVMADWHDVSATHVSKALRIILGASDRSGKGALGRLGNLAARGGIGDAEAAREILARYQTSGGAIGGWATQEIAREQLEPIVEALRAELAATAPGSAPAEIGVFSALQHMMHARFPQAWEAFKASRPATAAITEGKTLIDLYQAEDDVFRLAAWLRAKEEGATDADAGKVARKSFLDYSINAPWVAAMRQTGWPFIAYTYRAVPMLLEIAGKKPHKLVKLMAMAGALNWLGWALAGGGDDEDKIRRMLPDEKAGRVWGIVPKLIRMPWNDANGSPVFLDIRRWIPVGDVVDISAGQAAVPLPPAAYPGGPVVIMGEVLANKSMFTGKPITLETDTAGEKARKVIDHLWKAFAPNLLGAPSTYATEGVMGAAKGRTDAFGREMSVPQAVSSAVGLKLGSYPVDVLRRNIIAKQKAQVSEIDKGISQLKRQLQTNRITPEEFEAEMQRQVQKKTRLIEEMGEKIAE